MHAMHARRGSLESQSLLLHLEDACSFPNGVRQRNGQAAWVFYRFYPYLWVIVRRASWGGGIDDASPQGSRPAEERRTGVINAAPPMSLCVGFCASCLSASRKRNIMEGWYRRRRA